MQDKTITCSDCGRQFQFSANEQEFYASKGFTDPSRCPACRAARKAAARRGRDFQWQWRKPLRWVQRRAPDVPGRLRAVW